MQNPGSYKLPGRGKRQLRLRNLKGYVDTICGEAIPAKGPDRKAVSQHATRRRGSGSRVAI